MYPLESGARLSDPDRSIYAQPRLALVASVDPSSARAKVVIQPEGVLTGWLPVITSWAGHGWGLVCLPLPGDQVLIIPQEGRADHYIVIGSLFSSRVRPPLTAAGELVLAHQSGSSMHFLASGDILVTGNLRVTGDVSDFHGPLSGLRQTFDMHRHILNSGTTTPPTAVD